MRRDFIIGILASVIFHVGFLYGGKLADMFFKPTKKAAIVVEEAPKIELMEMPKIEPEEPEVAEEASDVKADAVDFAPPMQTDVPAIVTDTSFVQQIQPPPPEGVKPNPGLITIPKGSAQQHATKLTNVFNLAELDQIPVARYQAKPVYPFEMRRAGVTGEVTVGFIVDTQGEVRDAYAVKSTQREFEAAAIQAVSKWKFKAGKKGGKSVNTRMQVPIVFSITEE
ncbi:MAG: TonB family protein [Opitutae bacterium]|nr:TonB family protein [Opitutae bacterium]